MALGVAGTARQFASISTPAAQDIAFEGAEPKYFAEKSMGGAGRAPRVCTAAAAACVASAPSRSFNRETPRPGTLVRTTTRSVKFFM
jgi:hypothetical protein